LAPEAGSAQLCGQVIRETLLKGGHAYAPRVPTPGLAAAFVEPALAYLESRGGRVRLQRRLTGLTILAGRVATLTYSDGIVVLGEADSVVLAVPPWVAAE